MRAANKLFGIVIYLCLCMYLPLQAQGTPGFKYEVKSDGINLRSDSTTTSSVICRVNRGDNVDVVRELYEWYKVRLPSSAPAFVSKTMVMMAGNRSGRIVKDKVNVRLAPNISSAIIGNLAMDTMVNVLGEEGEWYKIEPAGNCYGWINKQFVNKVIVPPEPPPPPAQVEQPSSPPVPPPPADQVFEGKIVPYGIFFFKRPATHKLITAEKKIILLKGDQEKLNALKFHKARAAGKIIDTPKQKYQLLEVHSLEALD